MERNWLDITALILIIIGAINWGLIGFFEFDLISYFFGTLTAVTRIIFAGGGIACIYSLILFWKLRTNKSFSGEMKGLHTEQKQQKYHLSTSAVFF